MLITIYDSNRKKKADIGVNDSSTQVKEIHSDNVLSLSFTLFGRIELDVNDYVDFEGERYWLTEKYRPTQKSNQEWEYNVKLYGIESLIKRFLVLKTVDGENEPVFSLTAPARDHVAMIVECINLGMGTTDWKVGEVADTGNIIIDYEGTYCNEGLKKVAEAAGTEWWFDGMTVNVCRCEHGEELTLGYGNGILSIEPGTADNVKFYTRLFPTGSTRNIDPSRYGHSRLQLPGGIKYVDVNTDKYGIIHHYEQDAFSHIYPKRIGTISSVRSEEVTDEDGNPFTVYYFKDSGLDFDPNAYEIAGLVKQVTFQNGELNGREFEVNFNSETREFEIITIWPYDDGTQLPGGSLVPESGDEYILWNIRMPDEYYPIAEAEYLVAVNEYNAAHGVDVSVYKCPTDHVWVEDNGAEFYLGRRVRLESHQYFPETGYRSSRITKITRRVNLPSYVELEISDAVSKGGMENIEDSIDEVRNIVQTSNASIPDIIRSWENTPAGDSNIFSSKRTLKEIATRALSRLEDDEALGLIRFLAGAEFGDTVDSMLAGKGTLITPDGRIQTSRLEVRGSAQFMELIINRLLAQESDFVFTESGHIEGVELLEEGTYLLTLRKRWQYDFTAFDDHDVTYGSMNTLLQDGSYFTSWFRVLSVDTSANTLTVALYSDDEVPGGVNYAPAVGMNISRRGNAINEERQNCWYISAREGTIMYLTGVTKPILEEYNYSAWLGLPKNLELFNGLPINYKQPYLFARGAIIQDLLRVDYQGKPIFEIVDLGPWDADTQYIKGKDPDSQRYIQHQVWHKSCCWRCAADAATIGVPPRWNNTQWICIVGESNYSLSITSSRGRFFRIGQEYTTLGFVLKHGDEDISVDAWQVEWTRESDLPSEDLLWNMEHADNAATVEITPLDMPSNWKEVRKVIFRCTVFLKEGEDTQTYSTDISFI